MPFTDATGHAWPLTIDLAAAKRVRDRTGVNLLTLDLAELLGELVDPVRLCEVLYAIAKPDADAAGLDLTEFLRRMTFDLTGLTDQLLGELAGFFQQLGQTTKAEKMTRNWKEATQTTTDSGQAIQPRHFGTAATPSRESSGSIRTSQA